MRKPLREAIANAGSRCLLASDGLEQVEEIANTLGNYLGIHAAVSAETSPAESLILGCWAGIVGYLSPGAEELSSY